MLHPSQFLVLNMCLIYQNYVRRARGILNFSRCWTLRLLPEKETSNETSPDKNSPDSTFTSSAVVAPDAGQARAQLAFVMRNIKSEVSIDSTVCKPYMFGTVLAWWPEADLSRTCKVDYEDSRRRIILFVLTLKTYPIAFAGTIHRREYQLTPTS